jgi:mannosyltransferase OCH1-like enzyme
MASMCVPSCTEYLQAYLDLPKAVERADFFRYLIVLRYGGLYADTDVECMSSIDTAWLGVPANTTMAVGTEVQFDSMKAATKRTYVRQLQVRVRVIEHPLNVVLAFVSSHCVLPVIPHCLQKTLATSRPRCGAAPSALRWGVMHGVCAAAAMGVHGGAGSPGYGAVV